MVFGNLNLTSDAGKLGSERFDCIWVLVGEEARHDPLERPVLQWLDWKMKGQIARLLKDASVTGDRPIFIPTLMRLPTEYVALEIGDDMDAPYFLRNCVGMKFQEVVCLTADSKRTKQIERQIQQMPQGEFPEKVWFGVDG